MRDQLDRLLRYDVWANRETLSSLRQGSPPPKSLKWMGHIIGAEYLWLARLREQSSALSVWPELSVDGCAGRLNEVAGLWREFVDGEPAPWSREVGYTNSKGESWTSTVEEILTHVTIHSAYHRGQIAADLRAAGQVPAYTDYIHAIRQGLVR